MDRFCFATCCSLVLVWAVGCAPQQNGVAPAAKVKGTINMDGKAIPTGEIHFGMTGVPPRPLPIKDGAFSGEAPIGENQVEVFIWVEGPPSEKNPGERSRKNITPERYWGPKTILKATVAASGPNDFKFDITSK